MSARSGRDEGLRGSSSTPRTALWLTVAAAVVASLAVTATIAGTLWARAHSAAHERAERSAARTSDAIEALVRPMASFNEAVRASIEADPSASDADVAAFMERLYRQWSGLRSAAIAPGNTVTRVVPLEGNQSVVGLHYPDLPEQWSDIERAIASRTSVLSGPVELVQGGRGLVYRTPVFRSETNYWGVVSSVIDVTGLSRAAAQGGGRGWMALRERDGGSVVVGDPTIFDEDASFAPVDALGREWEVAVQVEPVDRASTILVVLLGILISVGAGVATYLLVSARTRTRQWHQLLDTLASRAPGMLFQLDQPPGGSPRVVYAGPGLDHLIGDPQGADAYTALERLVHPDDRARLVASREHSADALVPWHVSYRVVTPDGAVRWLRTEATPLAPPHGGIVWNGWIGDVTEELDEAGALRLSASLFQATRDGVVILDPDLAIIDVNDSATRLTGLARAQLVGRPVSTFTQGVEPPEKLKGIRRAVRAHGYWRGGMSWAIGSGLVRTFEASVATVLDDAETVSHYLVVLEDLNLTRDDGITGLPSSRTVEAQVRAAVEEADRSGGRVAFVVIGIDHFRHVNETFGHRAGDALLRVVADRLTASLPAGTFLTRLRGDEFAAVVRGAADLGELSATVDTCLAALRAPVDLARRTLRVTASAGIAIHPDDSSAEELADHAAQALRESKRAGTGVVTFFEARMASEASERQHLLEDLARALVGPDREDCREEFTIVLQPVVDLRTGTPVKAEALVRWTRPGHGLESPAAFVPVAEQSGLITDLGDVVFAHVIEAAARLREVAPDFLVGFNLSPLELQEAGERHARRLLALNAAGIPGHALVTEITEGAVLSNDPTVVENLARYRAAGARLAIDDFGTGYSSLSYLRRLDATYVKIDKTFVDRLAPEGSDLVLCRAIIAMAKAMDMRVVAEGVETEMQADLLREAGCDFAQGYLFARPMPLSDLLDLLRSGRRLP